MFKNLNLAALGISGRESEIIELLMSYGFKGLDLDLADFSQQVAARGLPLARRLIDSARLKFGSFRLDLDWDLDDAGFKKELEEITSQLELAKQVGCARATTIIEPASDHRPYYENYELHRRRYAELGDKLSTLGIRLGVGFRAAAGLRQDRAFSFIQSVDAFLMLVKSIPSKNVGVALDTWDWHLGGGTLDQIAGLGESIVTVGLADVDVGMTAETADEATRRLPGETGVVDCVALLSQLKSQKYTGPVTPLPSPAIFPGLGRDKIVKAAGAALDAVWKSAGLEPLRPVGARG